MTHSIVTEEIVKRAVQAYDLARRPRTATAQWYPLHAALEAVLPEYAAEAKALRLGHVQGYVGRRIDEREGDVTDAQIAEWEQRAGDHWDHTYPRLAGLAGAS